MLKCLLCGFNSHGHILHFSSSLFVQPRQLQQRHYKLSINEEVRGHTHITVLLSPWHQSDMLSLVTCLSVHLSVYQTRLPMRPCSKVTTSSSLCLMGSHSHSQTWMARRSCVSSSGHTAHQAVTAFVTLHTAAEESVCLCVCVWKVNTVSSSAAVRTLSLFSSQRSVWKAYCCANHGVTERAVPPQPTPAPLLNLRVWTVICTMVCTAQTLPVSGTSFFVVCCVKQLQNAVQKVNGSQWQKARTAAV